MDLAVIAVVSLVDDVERRTRPERGNDIELPSPESLVGEAVPVAAPPLAVSERKFIQRCERKGVPLIIFRVAIVVLQQASITTREDLLVAANAGVRATRIIQCMRPGVGRGELQTIGHAMVQARLQPVVVGLS